MVLALAWSLYALTVRNLSPTLWSVVAVEDPCCLTERTRSQTKTFTAGRGGVLRVRATRASAKCLLRGRSSEASSPWHGSHVMPDPCSLQCWAWSKKPNWGCGACGVVEWLGIGNWATRTVCKWSKNLMWMWSCVVVHMDGGARPFG